MPPRLHLGCVYGLWLDLPGKMKGDVDNRTKLISDVLAEAGGLGIVADDKLMRAHYVGFLDGLPADRCIATVVELNHNWPDYVTLRLSR